MFYDICDTCESNAIILLGYGAPWDFYFFKLICPTIFLSHFSYQSVFFFSRTCNKSPNYSESEFILLLNIQNRKLSCQVFYLCWQSALIFLSYEATGDWYVLRDRRFAINYMFVFYHTCAYILFPNIFTRKWSANEFSVYKINLKHHKPQHLYL